MTLMRQGAKSEGVLVSHKRSNLETHLWVGLYFFFSFFSLFVGNMAAFDMSLPEAVVSPGKVKKKSTS